VLLSASLGHVSQRIMWEM